MTVPPLTLVSFCGWLPVLCTDDRQADLALLVNIGVVDFCLEGNLRGLEGILRRENELNPKCSFVIWRAILGQNISFQIREIIVCSSFPVLNILINFFFFSKQHKFCQHQFNTYRNNEPLPVQNIRFIHLNVAEILHSMFANVSKLLKQNII